MTWSVGDVVKVVDGPGRGYYKILDIHQDIRDVFDSASGQLTHYVTGHPQFLLESLDRDDQLRRTLGESAFVKLSPLEQLALQAEGSGIERHDSQEGEDRP